MRGNFRLKLQNSPIVMQMRKPNREKGYWNPWKIKRFVRGISISFKCECCIVWCKIQHTKNLNLERSELGTTLSWPIWSVEHFFFFFFLSLSCQNRKKIHLINHLPLDAKTTILFYILSSKIYFHERIKRLVA